MMKRVWTMVIGLSLAAAACGDDGDGGSAADAAIDASAPDAMVDASACPATLAVSDPVTDKGWSCALGTTCIHYAGSGWTEAEARAQCNQGAAQAMATPCLYTDSFCARTTDSVCRSGTADKPFYVFSPLVTGQICTGLIMGTSLPKPSGGWPTSYVGFAPAATDGGAGEGGAGDAAAADAGAGDAGDGG